MKAQIKRIEAQIEKTQQIFHKDLEEVKNRQSAVNNIITEIKNALERTNSRITETEEWIYRYVCVPEDGVAEVTEGEQNS